MGFDIHLMIRTVSNFTPVVVFLLIPEIAQAQTPHTTSTKSLIETAETVVNLISVETGLEEFEQLDPDQPVFRFERRPTSPSPRPVQPPEERDAQLPSGETSSGETSNDNRDANIRHSDISHEERTENTVSDRPADTSESQQTAPHSPHESIDNIQTDSGDRIPSEPDADSTPNQASIESTPETESLQEGKEEELETETARDPSSRLPDDPHSDGAESNHTEPNNTESNDTEPNNTNLVEDNLSEEERRWRQLLIEGDRFFMQEQYLEAEARYQEAKDPKDEDPDPVERLEAFTDPALLSPAGQVYWREYQAGAAMGMETRIFVPLELLTEAHPEFIPAQVTYALLLSESDDEEAKQNALEILEQGTSLFPDNAELARARVNFLVTEEEWLQAAIAARQFTILNPEAPERIDFETDAEEYQRRFRSRLRGRLIRNSVGNAITGAIGFALTGNLFGPISALETSVMMLRGESSVGNSIANRAAEELDLIEDEEVIAYVDEIGQELASLAGRDEFDYEFYVIEEPELNAFALPGGKIFVNAGAILKAETEAELAGLIAHELAHSVLSHGFQLMTGGNLTANVLQFVPYGGYVTNLAVLRYSRGMERQADTLGTQLLANSHYAADGLHRLMITLYRESDRPRGFEWLSTHPNTGNRIRNIDRLIEANGYNRYAFEGIERHLMIQERVEQLLRDAEKLVEEEDITIQESAEENVEEESDNEI